jgi:hypothetical protein
MNKAEKPKDTVNKRKRQRIREPKWMIILMKLKKAKNIEIVNVDK